MVGLLISGPAGASKSAIARHELAQRDEPTVVIDFQSIVVALLQLQRGPDGKYPIRPDWILPLAEYTRQAAITGAVGREIDIIATNSDGDPERRARLLERLGPGATERVVDPGREVVEARLRDAVTEELEPECSTAVGRWYSRASGGRRR